MEYFLGLSGISFSKILDVLFKIKLNFLEALYQMLTTQCKAYLKNQACILNNYINGKVRHIIYEWFSKQSYRKRAEIRKMHIYGYI